MFDLFWVWLSAIKQGNRHYCYCRVMRSEGGSRANRSSPHLVILLYEGVLFAMPDRTFFIVCSIVQDVSLSGRL